MKNFNFRTVCSLTLLLFCSFVVKAENTIKLSEADIASLGIKLGSGQAVEHYPLLTASAKVTIPPSNEYVLSSSLPGLISRLKVAAGDTVKKGEVLAVMNSPELLTLQEVYLKAVNDRVLGLFTYQRDRKLFADGVIADKRWQETQSLYQSLLNAENEHKQLLKIAGMSEAEVKILATEHQLSGKLNLHSPVTGVVLDLMVITGERVASQSPIYRIGNLNELWLELAIPQERIGSIKIGDLVLIQNSSIQAKISLLGQSADPKNQTLLARAVVLKAEQSKLRVGEKRNVQIIQSTTEPVFSIPNSAIVQHEDKNYIFIKSSDGFLVTPISIIARKDNESFVTGELTTSQIIVIKGSIALKANWLSTGGDE